MNALSWCALFAVCWAVLLCGCESLGVHINDPTTFEVQQVEYRKTVYLYDDVEALRARHLELCHRCEHDIDNMRGFAQFGPGWCKTHVMRYSNHNDFWVYAGSWGHEEGHCVYGDFHRQ